MYCINTYIYIYTLYINWSGSEAATLSHNIADNGYLCVLVVRPPDPIWSVSVCLLQQRSLTMRLYVGSACIISYMILICIYIYTRIYTRIYCIYIHVHIYIYIHLYLPLPSKSLQHYESLFEVYGIVNCRRTCDKLIWHAEVSTRRASFPGVRIPLPHPGGTERDVFTCFTVTLVEKDQFEVWVVWPKCLFQGGTE